MTLSNEDKKDAFRDIEMALEFLNKAKFNADYWRGYAQGLLDTYGGCRSDLMTNAERAEWEETFDEAHNRAQWRAFEASKANANGMAV